MALVLLGGAMLFVGPQLLMRLLIVERDTPSRVDGILVLGNRLERSQLSRQNLARLDQSIELYSTYQPSVPILVSGGRSDETRTEAEAMRDYLLAKGIPDRDILLETESLDTYENLVNSRALITARHWTCVQIITSPYHARRVARFGQELGYDCFGLSYSRRDPTLGHSFSEQGQTAYWLAREIGAHAWFDLTYSNASYAWLLAAAAWAILACVKYCDMVFYNIAWCIRHGQAYYQHLASLGTSPDNQAIIAANEKFGRHHLRWTEKLRTLPRALRFILRPLYRFPTVFLLGSTLLVFLVRFRQPNWEVCTLISLALAGVTVQITLRFTSRLYLGKFADLDDSIAVEPGALVVTPQWTSMAAYRRVVVLFMIDVLLFVVVFSAIHFGTQYAYQGKAYILECSTSDAKPPVPCLFSEQLVGFAYFTVVTIGTTGFGDVRPINTTARLLSMIQIGYGIALFVGLVFLLSLTTRAEPFSAPKRTDGATGSAEQDEDALPDGEDRDSA